MAVSDDLLIIQQYIFDAFGFDYIKPIQEIESAEYNACSFTLNDLHVKFRTAKITPTKTGQFVTLWKRLATGIIAPFEASDSIDLVIISVRKENRFGQFVFPKSVLCTQGILTVNGKEGKRGFRVYPPWDETTNKQAIKTQNWQLNYFLDLSNLLKIDVEKVKKMYEAKSDF
jgi:hypothetical protein